MQTVLWQYRESAKRNALFIFIWAHTVTENANKILGRKDLARFFFRFKPCQSGSFCLADAWRHCTLAFWLTAATTKSSVASDFFYRSFAPEEISEMFVKFFEVTPTLTLTVVKLRSRSFATRFASGFESRNKQNLKGNLDITGRILKT